jgi:drug/metabolite transporter (DMT)-like permease
MPQHNPILGILLRLLATVALAIMFALVKRASEMGISVIESLFFRQLAGIPFVVALALFSQHGLSQLATQRPWAQARRMVLGLVAMGLNFTAAIMLPLAEATAIGYTVPIFATLLAIFLLGETVGRYRWTAIATGFIGMLIITQIWNGGHGSSAGIAVAIAGALLTALVSIAIRDLGRTDNATATVFWFSLLSMLPLGLAMIWFAQAHDAAGWMLLAGISVSGAIAQVTLTAALRLAPVAVVMPIDYISLIWASLLGWYIFADVPAITTWIGAALIMASALYIFWREQHIKKADHA